VQGVESLIGSGAQTQTPQAVLAGQAKQNVNDKNEVTDALECVLLYWAIRLTVNAGSSTPDPFIEFRLLRNSVTTLATIDFIPQSGDVTKAQLLNIPILSGEHFNFEIQQFGSGNTFYTWLFAGKMSAPPAP
jgi:hypothetical protein